MCVHCSWGGYARRNSRVQSLCRTEAPRLIRRWHQVLQKPEHFGRFFLTLLAGVQFESNCYQVRKIPND